MLELSTNLLAEIGGWPALKEARGLVAMGRVQDAVRDGASIRARVQGGEKTYDAQIVLSDRLANVEIRCTCIESRRSGRACAHVLAAGLALLSPPPVPSQAVALARSISMAKPTGPRRCAAEEAPAGTPLIECLVLLPLQGEEGLKRDPVRIILEAKAGREGPSQPWEAVIRNLAEGYAVDEHDARFLDALENQTGRIGGINEIPQARIGMVLRALDGHPRTWVGKKQRIDLRAAADKPKITLSMRADGALELIAETETNSSRGNPGWRLIGAELIEIPASLAHFAEGKRVVPHKAIPDFLARDWAMLEQRADLIAAPGFEAFRLETAQPVIEARLDGALSGLTLDLIAHYEDTPFPLLTRTETDSAYHPDPRQLNRFWRRDVSAEKQAIATAEAAGFSRSRANATLFSLPRENEVARFLANRLSDWRREWTVTLGPRLEATMRTVDIAEPEFALRGGSGEEWLGLDLKLSVGGRPVALDPAEIERWLQTGKSHGRQGERMLLVPTEAWNEMREVLADSAVDQEPGRMKVPRASVPFLTGALRANGFKGSGGPQVIPPPVVKKSLSSDLLAYLRPYQLAGVEWLAGLAQQRFHGLLADDMGLGKTVQALAFYSWLRADRPDLGPALVVCPTSLVSNWLREANKFTPHLRTLDLTGPDRAEKRAHWKKHDLLVTSYAILRRDIDAFREDEFSLVILDEAQHIKNRGSQNAQSAKALKAAHRLILTGTPLENSVLDLWSLYDFLLPGYLGTATDFRERYESPLARGTSPKVMERLRHRVRPFFLRRTKEEVLKDLPPKLDHLTLCELSDEQREVYRAVLAQGRRDVFERSGKSGKGRDRMAVLTTLLRLRQVSCHLELLPAQDPPRVWQRPSAKLERVFELIDEAVDGGHRVLLFSQFVRALHLLRDEARQREIDFCYLDGQTVERQAEVDRFQRESAIPLFFISLKAGGTGLNLTGADTVIHFDPWWNPAVEEQATARAHRLGQTRIVQAYKLIAAGTVEEKITALQARKRELFTASMQSDEAFAARLTDEDLEDLLAE